MLTNTYLKCLIKEHGGKFSKVDEANMILFCLIFVHFKLLTTKIEELMQKEFEFLAEKVLISKQEYLFI